MGITVSRASAATVSFTTPQEIVINHADDSIKIGDGTDLAEVTAANALKVDSSHVTQPVSAASLPLPSGAATSAKQDTGNTSVASIDSKMPTLVSGRVPTDGSGVTQPVSGTFWQATQPVSDTINGSGVQGALTVGTTAVEVKVGGSAHASRKLVTLYNNSSVILYWGWTNAVTTSNGTPIQPQQFGTWNVGPSATVYVIATSGSSNDTRVTEAS